MTLHTLETLGRQIAAKYPAVQAVYYLYGAAGNLDAHAEGKRVARATCPRAGWRGSPGRRQPSG